MCTSFNADSEDKDLCEAISKRTARDTDWLIERDNCCAKQKYDNSVAACYSYLHIVRVFRNDVMRQLRAVFIANYNTLIDLMENLEN